MGGVFMAVDLNFCLSDDDMARLWDLKSFDVTADNMTANEYAALLLSEYLRKLRPSTDEYGTV